MSIHIHIYVYIMYMYKYVYILNKIYKIKYIIKKYFLVFQGRFGTPGERMGWGPPSLRHILLRHNSAPVVFPERRLSRDVQLQALALPAASPRPAAPSKASLRGCRAPSITGIPLDDVQDGLLPGSIFFPLTFAMNLGRLLCTLSFLALLFLCDLTSERKWKLKKVEKVPCALQCSPKKNGH